MVQFLSTILCRITGRSCNPRYPSTKDIVSNMQHASKEVEKDTMETRRLRHMGEYALLHEKIKSREVARNGA